MAKTSVIAREHKRRKLAQKYAKKIESLKQVIATGTPEEAWDARMKLQKIPRNAHRVRQVRICAITGRSKGVYRKYGVSRHWIRILGALGYIPGLTKSSW